MGTAKKCQGGRFSTRECPATAEVVLKTMKLLDAHGNPEVLCRAFRVEIGEQAAHCLLRGENEAATATSRWYKE